MAGLPVPIVCAVIGEGGSGGALALGVANRILMLEYATYSVISPEGCASILWRDDSKKPEAAAAMKMTATDLQRLGVVDEVIPEAPGGAHRDHDLTARNLGEALQRHLTELLVMSPEALRTDRYQKFRHMGAFVESGDKVDAAAPARAPGA
jgi:acetyl-CoA carboxylase carboxyl transferase subunit alpha